MLIKVQEIYKSAIKCNDCFANNKYGIQRGLVSKAQPRWIGKNYFSSNILKQRDILRVRFLA